MFFVLRTRRYIYYFSETGDNFVALFQDSPELDAPVQITDKKFPDLLENQTVSPDGKNMAYIFWDRERRTKDGEIRSLTGEAKKSFSLPTSAVQKYGESQFVFRWTADGKNLSFINDENGFSNVWLLPLNGGSAKRITDFNDNFIFSFAWSNDGKNLAVSRGTLTSDAVLFTQK